jgi:hypothetical protein
MRVGALRTAYKVLVGRGMGVILGAHLIGPARESDTRESEH